jgi:predicted ATP-grasp superfamily ATP-dependent carboligase
LRLLIYEFVSGGGFCGKPIPLSILSEGFGMLRTITSDSKAAGHDVTTVLDRRIAEFNPPLEADHKIVVNAFGDAVNSIQEAAESADAVYIIAPESNNTLQTLVESVERRNIPSLNCRSNAIQKVSYKPFLQKHAETTPKTLTFSPEGNLKAVVQAVSEEIGYPAVVKPADGTGCEGLSVVTNKNQAANAINKIAKPTPAKFTAQELIQGIPASVTLISNGKEALPISLNKQNVSFKNPKQTSTYNGGTVPLDNPLKEKAFATAKKLSESIKGLQGYIGVDLVLTEHKPVLIEINPRLTTSYIGLQKITNLHLAQTIIDAVLEHKLPLIQKTTSYVHFAKEKTPNPTNEAFQTAIRMAELVSPPFPSQQETETYALICAKGNKLHQAKHAFNNAKKQLYNIINNGGKQ